VRLDSLPATSTRVLSEVTRSSQSPSKGMQLLWGGNAGSVKT